MPAITNVLIGFVAELHVYFLIRRQVHDQRCAPRPQ
jgi:hypothetical protein